MNAPLRLSHVIALLLLGGCIEHVPTEDQLAAKRALTAEAQRKSAEALKREQLSLDAATCAGGGDGHLYVALDRVVLRLPVLDEPLYRRPADPEITPLPPVPAPSEPEGCRGHPSHAQSVALWPHRRLVVSHAAFAGEPLLRLGANRVGDVDHMQIVHRNWLADLTAKGRCGTAAPGVRTCTDDDTVPASAYSADTAVHTAPDGGPFVALCGRGVSLIPQECRVIYTLAPGFNVEYGFYLPGVQDAKQQTLAPADLIAFDRAVRAGIVALIVEDYRWADE